MSWRTREEAFRPLERMVHELGVPVSITVDHGSTEIRSKAPEERAWPRGIKLDFIRPGKPNEYAHMESFSGRLPDECMNVIQFTSSDDARHKIDGSGRWRWRGSRHLQSRSDRSRCNTDEMGPVDYA